MRNAKVQVLVTLNGAGVFRIVSPLRPDVVRHLTKDELQALSLAIPRLIESVLEKESEAPRKKK